MFISWTVICQPRFTVCLASLDYWGERRMERYVQLRSPTLDVLNGVVMKVISKAKAGYKPNSEEEIIDVEFDHFGNLIVLF